MNLKTLRFVTLALLFAALAAVAWAFRKPQLPVEHVLLPVEAITSNLNPFSF